MDIEKASAISRNIYYLFKNPGWEWFASTLEARKADIREELTETMPEEKTARLREEYATLKRMLALPGSSRQMALEFIRAQEVLEIGGR